jgi:hypothetical protein
MKYFYIAAALTAAFAPYGTYDDMVWCNLSAYPLRILVLTLTHAL